jgi:hypothetical protein
MSPAGGDRRHSAGRAAPVILSKLADSSTASASVPPRLAEEVTMRHPVVNAQLLRQARAALDEEAARQPERRAKPKPQPQPQQEAAARRLVSLARRARALAVRVVAVRHLLRPRTDPR